MEAKTDRLHMRCIGERTAVGSGNGGNGVAGAAGGEGDSFVQCPTCEAKLKRFEVAEHCEQEMERLRQMEPKSLAGQQDEAATENMIDNENTVERRKPWSVFQRVQRNRQTRQKQRTRKRASVSEHPCPVCNVSFPQEEIQQHAEMCLRRNNGTANGRGGVDEHSSNDEDGDEYEEYEWAGQKRIRVSSLLQGGYASIGIGQTTTNGNNSGGRVSGQPEDEDEDLNVDEDDTEIYGPAQYGESDVIPSNASNDDEENDVTTYMRRLITGNTSNSAASTVVSTAQSNTSKEDVSANQASHNKEVSSGESHSLALAHPLSQSPAHGYYQQIIDSLKAKLRHYENHVPGKFKCLICLDDYRNPAISVSCWHVHCEQCWLRSLGARKLCPQCNLITTPKDLRRIYM